MKSIDKPEEAARHDQIIRSLVAGTKIAYTELAHSMYQMCKHKLYKKLDFESFSEYAASPEISVSRSYAYKLSKYWEVFVLELEMDKEELENLDATKLMYVLPVINKENKEEWMCKVEALSVKDLRIEVKEAKTGIRPEDCEHNWYHRRFCKSCGVSEKYNLKKDL